MDILLAHKYLWYHTELSTVLVFVILLQSLIAVVVFFSFRNQNELLKSCLPSDGPYTTVFRTRSLPTTDLDLKDFTSSRPYVVSCVRSWTNPLRSPVMRKCVPVVSVIGGICAGKSELLVAMQKMTVWPLIPEAIEDWKSDHGHNWFEEYNNNRETHALPFQMKIAQTQARTFCQIQFDLAAGRKPMAPAILSERSTMDALVVFADVNAQGANPAPSGDHGRRSRVREIHGISKCAKIQLLASLIYGSGTGWAPSIAVFVDVSPETCYQRKLTRARRGEEEIDLAYLTRVNARYRDYVKLLRLHGVPVITVGNTGDSLDEFVNERNVRSIVERIQSQLQHIQ